MTTATSALTSRGFFGADTSRLPELARQVCVGDIVFIRVAALPFRKVAEVTGSWTNHVGVIVESDGHERTHLRLASLMLDSCRS